MTQVIINETHAGVKRLSAQVFDEIVARNRVPLTIEGYQYEMEQLAKTIAHSIDMFFIHNPGLAE